MNSYRFAIRSIDPLSALKYGFVLGCILAVLPGFLIGVVLKLAIASLVETLTATLFPPDLGPLTSLYNMGWVLSLWTTVGTIVMGGVTGGISGFIGALVYDLVAALSGGLIVGTQLLDQPASAFSSPAPGSPAQPVFVPIIAPPPPGTPGTAIPQQFAASVVPATNMSAAPAGGSQNAWLALRDQPAQRWPVRQPLTKVGGSADCDIVLAGLVPHHADIRFENNRYILYDQSNGQTWVNDRQVTTANMLKDGFSVRMGNRDFIFQAT